MKCLVVYSSKTGNTRKVAEAVAESLPEASIYPVNEAPDPEGFDFIAIGYWVDRGLPDCGAKAYMQRVKGKKLGLFGTLGAYPESEHGRSCREKAAELVKDNELLCSFLCMGKVDPELIKKMATMNDKHHSLTPERIKRLAEAAKHPDAEDLSNARAMFSAAIKPLLSPSPGV